MIVVLVVAAGAPWETPALAVLAEQPDVVVLKRCVDVEELLAAASSGQADVAVVGLDVPGLDLGAVDLLRTYSVHPVAVVPLDTSPEAAQIHASRLGVRRLLRADALDDLPASINATAADSATDGAARAGAEGAGSESERPAPPVPGPLGPPPSGPPTALAADRTPGAPDAPGAVPPHESAPRSPGRTIAVWGPAGAPGRSTVAAAIAAELAARDRRTVLIDADPYGGSLAQQLGVLDEVSGLLSAGRLAGGGLLADRFHTVQRALDGWLSIVTGLPRPDRWVELRPGVIEHLIEVAGQRGDVVIDTGFSLEEDPALDFGTRPARNQLTLGALGVADEVVVVGGADPVGLTRLARGLVELSDTVPGVPTRVVVNQMRPSLGWREHDVAAMVGGLRPLTGLHFLPEDRAGVDRALVAGRTLIEGGDSPLVRALRAVVDGLLAPVAGAASRPRTAGRGRRR